MSEKRRGGFRGCAFEPIRRSTCRGASRRALVDGEHAGQPGRPAGQASSHPDRRNQVEEGARRFAADTHLAGPAAQAEVSRATFDLTYGRYTWGKLQILDLRERARKHWGASFSLRRFHTAMMDLGAPPLGLLDTALERG